MVIVAFHILPYLDISLHVWVCRVSQPPQNLDEFGVSMDLWHTLNASKLAIEAKFEPLSEQFAILEKYEVQISEEVSVIIKHLIV